MMEIKAQRRLIFWLFFALSAVLVVIVYFPSLFHVARADQLFFLADVFDKRTWADLALGTYDYTRTRLYQSGDMFLFRPFFYFIIGNETFFFGYRFAFWQLTGVVVHLLVVAQLLRLLLKIRVSAWAGVFALFFALLMMNTEMVAWHHATPFMVLVGLVLLAVEQAYCVLSLGDRRMKRFVISVVALTLAGLIHELGILYALVLGWIYFRHAGQEGRIGARWFLVALAGYCVLNLANLYGNRVTVLAQGALWPQMRGSLWSLLQGAFLVPAWQIFKGIVPGFSHIEFDGKTRIGWGAGAFHGNSIEIVVAGALIAGIVIVALVCWQGREGRKEKARAPFIVLLEALLAVFIFFVSAGRGSELRVEQVLRMNVHYAYYFWSTFLVLVYSIGNLDRLWLVPGKVWAGRLAVAIAVVLVFENAVLAYRINAARAKEEVWSARLVRFMESYVGDRGADAQGTFYVSPYIPGNMMIKGIHLGGEQQLRDMTLMELLYPRLYASERYQYRVEYVEKDGRGMYVMVSILNPGQKPRAE